MAEPFRFLHAAGFQLQRPLLGTAGSPSALASLAPRAPRDATRRVFDLALAEEVSFLLLTGDLLDPRQAGPAAVVFLEQQFARLAERGIAIYWAQGSQDRAAAWPSGHRWPGYVHVFASDRVEHLRHRLRGGEVVDLYGWSSLGGTWSPSLPRELSADGFALLAGYLPETPAEETLPSAPLCCLGGRDRRETRRSGQTLIHWCGGIQGRGPEEIGSHGCTLVSVSDSGEPRLTFHATDSVRWHRELVQVQDTTTLDELEAELVERATALATEEPPVARVVTFSLLGDGPLLRQLARESAQAELLAAVRGKVRSELEPLWIRSLDCSVVDVVPSAWRHEQTLLGDFVRHLSDLSGADLQSELKAALPATWASRYDDELESDGLAAWQRALVERVSTIPHEDQAVERLRSQVAGLGGDLLGASWSTGLGETT